MQGKLRGQMLSDEPLISIGITCYREGEWLLECWQSVLAQSDPRWEAVVILDGGADEATSKIFNQISHPKLRKFTLQNNVGPYLCRTLAILNSQTDWYAHLDGDDLLPEGAIGLILETIEANPQAEFVFGDAIHFDSKTEELKHFEKFNVIELVTGTNITGTSPIHRKLFWQLGGFAPELLNGGADWDFWIGVAERKIQGCRADGVVYKRRRRPESVGSKRRFALDKVAQVVIDRHPIYFAVENRRVRCLGKAYEMIARNYRSAGKRNQAAEYAKRAIDLGYQTSILDEIIREQKFNSIRYGLRRLARKLGK